MKDLNARPTEYLGIQYRSKCEAMFAAWLMLPEQSGYRDLLTGVIYEPEWLEIDGWKPDFVTYRVLMDRFVHVGLPMTLLTVIEYKPSSPTETYVEEWETRCKALAERSLIVGQKDLTRNTEWKLFYGSVFTQDRGIVLLTQSSMCDGECGELSFNCQCKKLWSRNLVECDWFHGTDDRIRSIRFDLKEQVTNGR